MLWSPPIGRSPFQIYTDTNGFMAGFQQAQGNTVADDAGSTRNEMEPRLGSNVNLPSPGITSGRAYLFS
jgi:hypothetical protein